MRLSIKMKLENIKKVCVKCNATCCKFGGPTLTKKERDSILKSGFKDYFKLPRYSGNAKGYFEIKCKKGVCPYLKNCLCKVHKVRPVLCKIWPVFPMIKKGKMKYYVFECPLAPYLSNSDIKKMAKLAGKMPPKIYKISWGEMTPKELNEVMKYKAIPLKQWLKNHA